MANNTNVFSDDFEADIPDHEMDHLPASRTRRRSSEGRPLAETQNSEPRRSISPREETDRAGPRIQWRSSISKNPLENGDGPASGARLQRTNTGNEDESRNRAQSIASSFAPFEERSRSPVHGRYASRGDRELNQSGLPRDSTSSRAASLRRSLYARAQPAHPYGLYTQTGIPLDDGRDTPSPAVGFPGANPTFHRQIGPDGEEQDIIGPDGHSEELPPYSRYPDEAQMKVAQLRISPVMEGQDHDRGSSDNSIRSPVSSTRSPVLGGGTIALNVHDGSMHSRSSSEDSKKKWKEKNWKEKRRTRVCGGRIPLCWLLASVTVIVIVVFTVGGVLGGLLAAKTSDDDE